VKLSPDGNYLAAADGDSKTALLWDAATGSDDKLIGLWDVTSGQRIGVFS
jgi:WD40 repeat protein